MVGEPVLEVRHLNSYYEEGRSILGRKGKRRQVLHDVSFQIARGEIVGLVGESGCGKTTLSRTILGMIGDYEGEIIHHSQRPQMVFQDPYSSLNPARTIGWKLPKTYPLLKRVDQAILRLIAQPVDHTGRIERHRIPERDHLRLLESKFLANDLPGTRRILCQEDFETVSTKSLHYL